MLNTSTELRRCFEAGYEAGENGANMHGNPFRPESNRGRHWEAGRREAFADLNAEVYGRENAHSAGFMLALCIALGLTAIVSLAAAVLTIWG